MAKFSRFRFQPLLPLGPKGRFVTGCTSHPAGARVDPIFKRNIK